MASRKLTPEQEAEVRSAIKQRNNLYKYIREQLGNQVLAAKYGCHKSTIEKIAYTFDSWGDR